MVGFVSHFSTLLCSVNAINDKTQKDIHYFGTSRQEKQRVKARSAPFLIMNKRLVAAMGVENTREAIFFIENSLVI